MAKIEKPIEQVLYEANGEFQPNEPIVHGWGKHGMKLTTLVYLLQNAERFLADCTDLQTEWDDSVQERADAKAKAEADARRKAVQEQIEKGDALVAKMLADRERLIASLK